MCLDWLIIGLATSAATTWLTANSVAYAWLVNRWLATGTFCVGVSAAGLVFGLYEHKTLLARSRILIRSLLALSLGVVLAFACLPLFFHAAASRWVGLVVFTGYALVAIPIRLCAHEAISTSRVRLLCVGNGPSIRKLVSVLRRMHRQPYEVIGHVRVADVEERHVAPVAARFQSARRPRFAEHCPFLGSLDDVPALLANEEVDEVVVGSELASNRIVGRTVALCLGHRCRVTDQATFIEKLLGEVPAESITPEWFLRADIQNRGNYETVRRLMDVGVAGVALVATLPFWPLIALAVWLDGGGPVFFRQVRVGRFGRPFQIYKFRTMRHDAERDGARWAAENDGRVTRVGRFLRKSRLDELPQLINILRGEMSLVGPRPERPEFVRDLAEILPHYCLRHLVKPGLSGWAQIHYGYGSNVADAHRKLCYDLYYLKHRSLELDCAILIRTFGTFLLGAR